MRQSSDQFLAEHDEDVVTAEGHVASRSQDAVDPGNNHYQLPVSLFLISEAQRNPSSSSRGNGGQATSTGHNEQVVSLSTNNAGEEPSDFGFFSSSTEQGSMTNVTQVSSVN